nr:hypothetical protein [Saccharopolyspora sp. ASAGF58]
MERVHELSELTGLSTISCSLESSETPSDDQARVPTSTTESGSCSRITGMISSA